MAAEETHVEIYQVHVLLVGISPAIWRRLLVRSDSTVDDLHSAIQVAMDWSDECLHRFRIHGRWYGQNRIGGPGLYNDCQRPLSAFSFRTSERFVYEYDFISWWRHQIRVERILPLDLKRQYPVCIAGRLKAPPEDCGGPWRFMERRDQHNVFDLLECLDDLIEATNETIDDISDRTAEVLEWVDRDRFDRGEVNRRLRGRRVGNARMGGLVQQQAAARTDRKHSPGGS